MRRSQRVSGQARIVFRVDASVDIGSGHVSRCLNLADELRERGATCHFVTRELPGHLSAWIVSRGHRCTLLRPPAIGEAVDSASAHSPWLGVTQAVDAAETVAAIDMASDWLICDHYAIDATWQSVLRRYVGHILVIDDLGDRAHDCDVLVDQNSLPSLGRDYSLLVPERCRRLLGVDYALMSKEYGRTRPCLPPRCGPIRDVLIFFGGADSHNLSGRSLEAIEQLRESGPHFHIVVGNTNPERARIAERAASLPQVTVHSQQASLVPLMARADIALGAGGVTMWERCALGLPSLVVTVADNQREGTAAAAHEGLVIALGDHSDLDAESIAAALRHVLSEDVNEEMSKRCANAVDALGASRVAAAMIGTGDEPLRLRRATPADETRLLIWANDPDTRRQAFQTRAISEEDHANWFTARLRDLARCRLYIAEAGAIPVGQIRFDLQGDEWLISYSVDLALRGRGFGGRLLEAGIGAIEAEYDRATFRALVRLGNAPSCRVFETAGFDRDVDRSSGDEAIVFLKRVDRRPIDN